MCFEVSSRNYRASIFTYKPGASSNFRWRRCKIDWVTESFHNHWISCLQLATTWQRVWWNRGSFPDCDFLTWAKILFQPEEDLKVNSCTSALFNSRSFVFSRKSGLLGEMSTSVVPAPRCDFNSSSIRRRGTNRSKTLWCSLVGCMSASAESDPSPERSMVSWTAVTIMFTVCTKLKRITAFQECRSSAHALCA